MRKFFIAVCLVGTVFLLAWIFKPSRPAVVDDKHSVREVVNRPVERPSDGYVGSAACRECHVSEHASWHQSFHRTMTQVVTPESVIGNFDNVTLQDRGEDFFLKRRDDDFVAELNEPVLSRVSGRPVRVERSMVLSTGSHHMQFYWYPTVPDSPVLGLFPFAYLKEAERWVPRDSVFLQPHREHHAIELGRWNMVCIGCHSTHGKPGIVMDDHRNQMSTYDAYNAKTSVAEFGIACEACHGPGEKHVEHFSKSKLGESDRDANLKIIHPGKLTAERSVEVCGQCHGITSNRSVEDRQNIYLHGESYRPGDELSDSKVTLIHKEDYEKPTIKKFYAGDYFSSRCWNDGMVRISGREYSAVSQSPCFEGGKLTCLTCHQMHKSATDERPIEEWTDDQLKPGMRSNAACTPCHEQFVDEKTLAEHTHHIVNSSGSNCYNCHASYTTYGLLKAIRSHSIESPNVATTLQTGRPNACNQCHLDRSLGWTADHLQQWYEIQPPKLSDDDRQIAASIQWLLKGDAGQRALMAWSFGWPDAQQISGTDWMVPFLSQLFDDPYDAVRYIAGRSLKTLPAFADFDTFDFLAPSDERQATRDQARAKWQTESRDLSNLTPLLFDENGKLMTDKFESLLKARDDREVGLAE